MISVALLAGYFFYQKTKSPVFSEGGKIKKTYTVTTKKLKSTINLSGKIEAEEKATLQFAISGKLNWVGVKEGDRVKKWQVLATLDQRELQKTLEKYLLDYMDNRWDFEQWKDDNKKAYSGGGSTYITDQLTRLAQQNQFSLDKTVLDVELKNIALENSRLISPIDGIVTQIDQPFSGVNITPTGARITVVNPETIYLRNLVDQQDIVKLREGARAEIVFDAFPDQTYPGVITYLSYAQDADEDNSYVVKISVPPNKKADLRLGMGAEIVVNLEEKNNVLAIPIEALITEDKNSYVTVLGANNKLQKRKVITGIETDEDLEIKKGLKKGEVIVY
jgi:macrolide-specific efflux system membrane fusion protein